MEKKLRTAKPCPFSGKVICRSFQPPLQTPGTPAYPAAEYLAHYVFTLCLLPLVDPAVAGEALYRARVRGHITLTLPHKNIPQEHQEHNNHVLSPPVVHNIFLPATLCSQRKNPRVPEEPEIFIRRFRRTMLTWYLGSTAMLP